MLGSACVRLAGCSSRSPRTRENAAEAPRCARPCRCRPGRYNGARCTADSFVGLWGGLVPVAPALGPEDVLGDGDGLGDRRGLGPGDAAIAV